MFKQREFPIQHLNLRLTPELNYIYFLVMNNTNEAKSQLDQLTSFLINAISAQQQHQYVEQLQKAIQNNQKQNFHTVSPPTAACTVQRIDPVTRKSVLYRPGSNKNYVNLGKEEPKTESIKSYAGIVRNDKERTPSGNSLQPILGLQQNNVLQQACQMKWMESVKQQQYAWFLKSQQLVWFENKYFLECLVVHLQKLCNPRRASLQPALESQY